MKPSRIRTSLATLMIVSGLWSTVFAPWQLHPDGGGR